MLATHLCHYRGFNFWRFDLTILCGLPQRTVEYMVVLASDHAFTFHNKCVLQGGRRARLLTNILPQTCILVDAACF